MNFLRNTLFWSMSIAAAVIGLSAVYDQFSMMSGESKRADFDHEMRLRYDKLTQQRQQFLEDGKQSIAKVERDGNHARETQRKEIAEQIAMIEKQIETKEEEQKYVDCLISETCDQTVPGLAKFAFDADLPVPENNLLSAVRVSGDGKTCEFRYNNRGACKVSPDVTIDFFDKDGRFLGRVRNVWIFTGVASGSTAVDREAISFDVGMVKYVRVRTEGS